MFVAQSCLGLCDPMDCSPPGSSVQFKYASNTHINKIPHICSAAAAKSLQSCPALCDPIDGSPPGSPTPRILQARTLAWVTISFSNAWKWKWSHSIVSDSQRPHGLQPTRLLCLWDSPGDSTGVGCRCLLRYVVHSPKYSSLSCYQK